MKNIQKIHIGIVTESITDAYIYQKLCEKMFQSRAVALIFPASYVYVTDRDSKVGKGRITKAHLVEIREFYRKFSSKKLKIVIIGTDHDWGKAENTNELKSEAEKQLINPKIIVTEPHENIESWLMEDTGALNKVFKMSIGALSNKELEDPKDLFNQFCGEKGLGEAESRRKIADEIIIDNIKSAEFIDFKSNLINLVESIINPKKLLTKNTKKKRNKNSIEPITKSQGAEIIILLKRLINKINVLNKKLRG